MYAHMGVWRGRTPEGNVCYQSSSHKLARLFHGPELHGAQELQVKTKHWHLKLILSSLEEQKMLLNAETSLHHRFILFSDLEIQSSPWIGSYPL